MARIRDAGTWAVWHERLRRFEEGDSTVAQFCQRERVSIAAFYEWRRKIDAQAGSAGGGESVSRGAAQRPVAPPQSVLPPRFVEVQVVAQRPGAEQPTRELCASRRVEIRLPNGACVFVAAHDIAALRASIVAAGEIGTREAGGDEPC